MDAYWRAANYLSVGQIYLLDNPLLREPLKREHIKPRLLGHWGTSPGLNMICVHLNRVIKRDDLDMIYIIGPGHGGPSMVAHAYLEGTYSEVYPEITHDLEGMSKLFKQFSFPGGIPSHVAPETPGSIHEGGELGYALSHAYSAKDSSAFQSAGRSRARTDWVMVCSSPLMAMAVIHSANRRKLGRVKAQAKADSRACQIDQSRLGYKIY